MITAYLKPTNYCNVGCSHCYLTEETRADKGKMGMDTLAKTARMLEGMRAAQRKERVHIIWHGGEPLTLPAEYFLAAGALLDIELPGHTESLQSSLIPLREDHLPWIRDRLRGQVGSSMDFSARTVKGSPESYQSLWMAKVNLCRENGIEVIPGITPAKPEIRKAEEIMSWMEERGFGRFNIERYNSYKFIAPNLPNNQEHADFLWDLMLSAMSRMEKKGDAPKIRVLASAIGGVLHGVPGDRWGGSCQSDFVVIEPNGSLNNCPDKASREAPYSNVKEGFGGFAKSEGRRQWIRIQAIGHRESHCRDCENNAWCKSGCPLTRNKPNLEGGECSGYRSLLSRIREFLETERGLELGTAYLKLCQPGAGLEFARDQH